MTNAKDRSNRMKSLFASVNREELEKHIPSPAGTTVRPATSGSMSGAVKSMQQTFSAVEAENERLRAQLQSGASAVELDPASVVPAFVRDRMDFEENPEFAGFVEGIRREGQKLPILVRPLPDHPGQYQIAYGHRRHRACQIIGIPVRAIVMQMTDEELVVAQGIENAERENPSFIEQALYASDLKKRGFSRETIARALGRNEEKGLAYISMLTATANAVPEALARRIGPAPATGRPKWEKLGAFFKDQKLPSDTNSALNGLVGSEKFRALASDERFTAVMRVLDRSSRPTNASEPAEIDLGHGVVVTTKRTPKAMQISIPHAPVAGLSTWLVERLPTLLEEFKHSERGEEQ